MKHLRILTVQLEFETRKVICHVGINTQSWKRKSKKDNYSTYHCIDTELAYEGLEELLKAHGKANISDCFRLYIKLSLLEIIADHLTVTFDIPTQALKYSIDTAERLVDIKVGMSPVLKIKGLDNA